MECANCGRKFWSHSLPNCNWCKAEKVLLCRSCVGRSSVCPSCGTKTNNTPGFLFFMGLSLTLAFCLTLALSLPGDISGIQANEMPVTEASHLSAGATAKVFGTVSPGQGAVITVFTYHDSYGNAITGRHVEPFWFNDSTGRVLVRMGANSSDAVAIENGGQPYPADGSPTGFQYQSGDPISIIGVASLVGNVTVLQATNVASSPTSFSHASVAGELEFFVPLLGAPAAVLVLGVAWQRGRLREHALHLPQWTAKRPKALRTAAPGDNVRWLDNPYPGRLRRISVVAYALAVVLAALFLVVVVSPIVFPYSVYLGTLVGAPVGLLFALPFGFGYGQTAKHAPTRVGLSSTGVYLDYPHPPKNARAFIAWSDVRELEAPLAVNKYAAKLDTPLGTEYLLSIDASILPEIRAAFEAGRTPFRDRAAPIRPSLASLVGAGAPLSVADVQWSPNPLRTRWMRNGVILLLLEIPALALLVLLWPRVGLNQGDALFFLPLMFGASQLWGGYAAIRAVGLSSIGISLRERKGERTILWSDIEELTPGSRGLRYKTYSGFAEALPLLDASVVRAIADAMASARGVSSTRAPVLPPPETLWQPNLLKQRARLYLVLLLGIPLALTASGAVWAFLEPSNPAWIFLVTLPVVVLVFALYPYALYRSSPDRIAVTSEALFVDRGSRPAGPGELGTLRLTDIASLSSTVGRHEPAPTTLGMPSVALYVKTSWGVLLAGGMISPGLAKAIAARMRPDQVKEWKVPP